MLVGCGGPSACVATGKVLVDGKPAEGVYLVFHTVGAPAGQPDSGTTRSDSDGSFSLVVSTPGEAVITAFWPMVTQKDGDTVEGADQLGGFYRDARRPASKATIREGETTVDPIMLTRPKPGKTRDRDRR